MPVSGERSSTGARAKCYSHYLHDHVGGRASVTRHRLVPTKCELEDSPILLLQARGSGNLTGAAVWRNSQLVCMYVAVSTTSGGSNASVAWKKSLA